MSAPVTFPLGAIVVLVLSSGFALPKEPVPPAAERPWAPPRIDQYERELAALASRKKGDGRKQIDPQHIYALAELIDLAQRNNPETRVAWERAREAAALVGLSK